MMRSALTLAALFMAALALPLLYDGNGFSRLGAAPTPLAVMEGIPEELAPEPPRQIRLDREDSFTIERNGHRITALESFSMSGLVLSRQDYSADLMAGFSPTDLALGWGPMSNPVLLEDVRVAQSRRFSFSQARRNARIRMSQVLLFSSNMHMIPSDMESAEVLRTIRKGEIVDVRGHLVRVEDQAGRVWESSLRRDDRGAGACEIILIDSITKRSFGSEEKGT